MTDVDRELRQSYGRGADAWAVGPARVYSLLADALVACVPVPLAGQLVLDLGAGTGVASVAAIASGARVIASDVAAGMLHYGSARVRPPCAPTRRISRSEPVRSKPSSRRACYNHVPDLVAAFAESARVTSARRRGGRQQLLDATASGESRDRCRTGTRRLPGSGMVHRRSRPNGNRRRLDRSPAATRPRVPAWRTSRCTTSTSTSRRSMPRDSRRIDSGWRTSNRSWMHSNPNAAAEIDHRRGRSRGADPRHPDATSGPRRSRARMST